MKASVWLGENKFEIREINIPKLNDEQVLVKVERDGLCGTDVSSVGIDWAGDEISKFYKSNVPIVLLTKGLSIIDILFFRTIPDGNNLSLYLLRTLYIKIDK